MRQRACSQYPEDVYDGGHSAVYGSYYCLATHRWGYACCLLLGRDQKCVGAPLALEDTTCSSGGMKAMPLPRGVTSVSASAPATATSSSASAAAAKRSSCPSAVVGDEAHAAEDVVGGDLASATATTAVGKSGAEVERVLAAAVDEPHLVLAVCRGAEGHVVRSAFRHIALLVHPDKNPGQDEERCRLALAKASAAREALEVLEGKSAKASMSKESHAEGCAKPFAAGMKRRAEGWTGAGPIFPPRAATPAAPGDSSATGGQDPEDRSSFETSEAFVCYALQFVLDDWQRFVHLQISDGHDASASAGICDGVAPRRGAMGSEAVLRSEAALKDATASVKALRKLLRRRELGQEVLEKIDQMCCELMLREYATANQTYMGLAIGNKTWHLEVPSLLEGGLSGCSGVERGRLFKQARTAQKLNASSGKGIMDDDQVRSHVVTLRRLLAVAQGQLSLVALASDYQLGLAVLGRNRRRQDHPRGQVARRRSRHGQSPWVAIEPRRLPCRGFPRRPAKCGQVGASSSSGSLTISSPWSGAPLELWRRDPCPFSSRRPSGMRASTKFACAFASATLRLHVWHLGLDRWRLREPLFSR
eukprot:TRINITY_DN12576_c0_g1_i3.p1 TRINITY_DN12576_c0_g1~~TRINITY_DN12576_c0_g1_i3.p1  ORF type:complete len:591 (-),score=91.17 TRINITY_DN12576_c0_g1_i3:527-2299(-)